MTSEQVGRATGASGGPTTHDWWVGLSDWILQDGNYTDFAVGDVRQFALELGYRWSRRLRAAPAGQPVGYAHTGRGCVYDVTADVVRSTDRPHRDAFVLDFGVPAYATQLVLDNGEPPARGARLTGEVGLAVDHFAYFDDLADLPGMPALIHTWTILDIQVASGPTIRVEHGHPHYGNSPDEGPRRILDPDRTSWASVDRTRTWDDLGGYRLRCALHPGDAVRTMSASGDGTPYAALTSVR